MLKFINYICFLVRNLNDLIYFYRDILFGKLLLIGKKIVYFEFVGLWIVLNEEKDILCNEIYFLYIYIVFIIDDSEFKYWY